MLQNDHRLLVMDDDEYINIMYQEIAEACGYSVAFADNLQEFDIIYQKFQPSIIFLDLALTNCDGIEVLRYLAEHHCQCPIIVISSHDSKVRSATMRLGESKFLKMDSTLQKPIDIKMIQRVLNNHKQLELQISQSDLEHAIENNEFEIYLQPKVEFPTQKVVSAECLVRWNHPGSKRIIYPEQFITTLEKVDLIQILSHHIIEKSFEIIHSNNIDINFSINLSGKDLVDLGLPDEIYKMAKKYHIAPEQVGFEITETSVMSQPKVAIDILTRLRILGFSLLMDDFGIGYSSLIELHRMPFSEIKIDKSFIISLDKDLDALPLVRGIINLAKGMNLKVTAEGVETKYSWNILKQENCDYAQGYFISKAICINNFIKFLHKSSTNL